jgi:hypothetical protein
MTSATSNDDGALVKTAAARVGFSSLPLDVIFTHILRSDFLPEPGDLGRLRAVSKDMRERRGRDGARDQEAVERRSRETRVPEPC